MTHDRVASSAGCRDPAHPHADHPVMHDIEVPDQHPKTTQIGDLDVLRRSQSALAVGTVRFVARAGFVIPAAYRLLARARASRRSSIAD